MHEHLWLSDASAAKRFWSNVQTGAPPECWRWGRKATPHGYGISQLRLRGGVRRRALAHRISWSLSTGRPVPASLCVLHKCDNPPCCNPDHLFLGTQGDNNRDCALKGRARRAPRLRRCLSPRDARAIAESTDSARRASERYGVSSSLVIKIRRGLAWRGATGRPRPSEMAKVTS